MNYVNSFKLFGLDVRQIPCICGEGAPDSTVLCKAGCLYLDIVGKKKYLCTEVTEAGTVWVDDDTTVVDPLWMSVTLGEELYNSDSVHIGDWTLQNPDEFFCQSGNTSSLQIDLPQDCEGKLYNIEFTSSSAIGVDNLDIYVGGEVCSELYGRVSAGSHASIAMTCGTGQYLEFTPSGAFEGTISAISIREILAPRSATHKILSIDQQVMTECRLEQNNNFIGLHSGRYCTSGTDNIGIGMYALRKNTSGFWNVALGQSTLEANQTGSRNIAIGHIALQSNTTGLRNVAIGTFALPHNTTGFRNVSIGADSMNDNTSGSDNVAIGYGSLRTNISGTYNVAIGYAASGKCTGSSNTCIGSLAHAEATTASECVAIGVGSLRIATSGGANVAVGNSAGSKLLKGQRCTFIGRSSNCTDASNWISNSTAIGYGAIVDASNQVVIGNDSVTETKLSGDIIIRQPSGVAKQLVFNDDNTITWVAVQ